MIPAPPSGKPVAFTDTECFSNYWTLKLRVQYGPLFSFSLRSGQCFTHEQIVRIDYLLSIFTIITFNGRYYDEPIINAALQGFTCEQLKWLSDEIIIGGRKPWELGLPEWRIADHIDVMEVLPGSGSQKVYAGRTHAKTMRDLPFDPDKYLTEAEIVVTDSYCENDLSVLEHLYIELQPQRTMRDYLSQKWGMDLRSKSDAQCAEAIIKRRCEDALKRKIYKPEIDWNLKFRYDPPPWLGFQQEDLRLALSYAAGAIFRLDAGGRVEMPAKLEGLEIRIGSTTYKVGIGGLHSKDTRAVWFSDAEFVISDNDVASYYPNLILISGKYPPALGPVFRDVLKLMMDERLSAKDKEKALKKLGQIHGIDFEIVHCENEGGKVMINGTFGKTGSLFSILFAPEMMIQTTLTGQLALLMLIEWHELNGIQVISANTDGIVIRCPRNKVHVSKSLIEHWEKTTGLKMESTEYAAMYIRDVNNYFAIYTPETAKREGKPIKRKGEYATAGLIEKKNPDVEICSDAVAEFLVNGTPILYTIAACRDIRKFVTMQNVSGGAVKLWGHGPNKDFKVIQIKPILIENGWSEIKRGHWQRGSTITDARGAYASCFAPQQPEYLGKVVRWYYGTNSPGSIIYNTNGNTVSLSYGAQPCMVLPDEFPGDIDYEWYIENCEKMLLNIGYYTVHCKRCRCETRGGICQNYGCESDAHV